MPHGDITVDVTWSTINYDDGLCLTGQGGLVRNYPHVPGIDFSDRVSSGAGPAVCGQARVFVTFRRWTAPPHGREVNQARGAVIGVNQGLPPEAHNPESVRPSTLLIRIGGDGFHRLAELSPHLVRYGAFCGTNDRCKPNQQVLSERCDFSRARLSPEVRTAGKTRRQRNMDQCATCQKRAILP